MKKKVRNWSGNRVISFTQEECDVYGFDEGDVVEIEIIGVEKKETQDD